MVRALCSHRRGRGFEPLYLYQRFERRLEAIQKNGSLAQVPLPFFLPRPLPCSPLRADIGKRNCDARQASLFRHYAIASFLTRPSISTNASSVGLKRSKKTTTLSLRSLRLSAKRQLSRSCYQFIIDVSTVKRSPSTSASIVGLKRSKKREFGTSATPFVFRQIR